MALGDKVLDFIGTAIGELSGLVGRLTRGGFERFFMDRRGEMKPSAMPAMAEILDNPQIPEHVKALIRDASGDSSPWDWITYVIMQVGGILSIMGALGQPTAEALVMAQWETTPFRREDPSTLITEYLRGRRSLEDIKKRIATQGYDGDTVDAMITTVLPLMDLDALRELELREAPEAGRALADARKAGWSDDQIQALRVLYWRIPPAQDLITMAVREAFTPEIARKFGQYEDFPPDFAKWAAKQGISQEWAERYWASHWDLPSPMQGFDMLHRGIIDDGELNMLLRALDVMPFWRDKLIQTSWHIPTRVDIRRMYKLGVYTAEDVKNTYIKAGYHPDDAESLKEFTIRYYATEERDEDDDDRSYTKSEILDGYRKAILTHDEAFGLLRDEGYQEDQVEFYMRREDLKKDQALRDAYLTRYRLLYVEGIMEFDAIVEAVAPIGIAEGELQAELPLWQLDRITRVSQPTKAEVNRWLKNGLIDADDWYAEMKTKGYSDRYIELYRKELPSVGGE